MTRYAALIYTADVDWSKPEHADSMVQYNRFGEDNATSGALPTSTATVVRVKGARVCVHRLE